MKTSIKKMKLADLIPTENNPRQIKKDDFERLKKSIKSFPEMLDIREIVVDENNRILGGHQRVKALLANGEKEVNVKVVEGLSEEEKREFVIRDNIQNGEWDSDMLANEWDDLPLDDWGIELPIADIEEEIVEDEAPEPPAEPKSKLGEIYQLGEHRLMCGDSTDEEQISSLMDGKNADLVFTSPPYNNGGSAIETGHFGKIKSQRLYGKTGISDNMESQKYVETMAKILDNMFKFTEGFIFWNVNYNANSKYEFIAQIIGKLEYLTETICWKKQLAITNTTGGLTRIWEPIFVFSTNGEKIRMKQTMNNFWEISNVNASFEQHKACFPVKLPSYAIENIEGDISSVLDPFGGSGSTLIACEQLGRKCYMMELDPHYVDVIIERWENLTGKKAERIK